MGKADGILDAVTFQEHPTPWQIVLPAGAPPEILDARGVLIGMVVAGTSYTAPGGVEETRQLVKITAYTLIEAVNAYAAALYGGPVATFDARRAVGVWARHPGPWTGMTDANFAVLMMDARHNPILLLEGGEITTGPTIANVVAWATTQGRVALAADVVGRSGGHLL
jgi:hypothetical protein